ncbi:acetate/propionate family kinase [Candidatus Woesearchaeota archaeon]|nr:acetate/propionate family kinase [Candidatus Woesearchaeota archaeon]
MNILVLNVGSSSIKYTLFKNTKILFSNLIERIGEKKGKFKTHSLALKEIKTQLTLKNANIDVIGHRVVHGGKIKKPSKITNNIIKKLKKVAELAPLHEIPEIKVIELSHKLFPKQKQYAVFDTAFYHTLPNKAKIYGIPYKFFRAGIQKFGFHGLSHKYVSQKLKGKTITCHLGSGCSITAIKNKKAIDTSMGFTPLEGLVMGTRSGSLDPAIIPYLIKHQKLSLKQIDQLLNRKSGLLGISGISNDLRDLLKNKNPRAKLAVEIFIYKITQYIGSYTATLNGLDNLVFTAGIGENSHMVREKILNNLSYLGIKIDKNKNKTNAKIISTKNSKVKVMVTKTNETLMIAKEILKITK